MMGMTITKQYVEMDEVLGILISCRGCRASLNLPMASDHMRVPGNCPHCGIEWSKPLPPGLTTSLPSKAERLAHFFEAFHKLRLSLESKSEPPPFTLNLEIAPVRKEGQQ
jgi:hypothetical protein